MDEYVQYDLSFGDSRKYKVGPVEFLNLIRGAEYIFTDSFHGTIFSIVNHKCFLTFNRYSDSIRKGKNSRIESLFYLLGLEERHYNPEKFSVVMNKDIDYFSVEEKLRLLRKDTWDFLKNALNLRRNN